MIWFTADLHFGHEAVIRMQNRPFVSAAEMNEILIRNINECVSPQDKLYILGDVSHHITLQETNDLLRKIHGRKYLIYGNHDMVQNPEVCLYDPSLFEFEGYYLKINAYEMNIIMMHYPMLSWDKSRHGSVMAHGHIHSTPAYNQQNIREGIRRFDVGVDANNYSPVSILQIKQWAMEAGNENSHKSFTAAQAMSDCNRL